MVSRHKWLLNLPGVGIVSKLIVVNINLEQFLGIYRATI